jgi:hypothetical protein
LSGAAFTTWLSASQEEVSRGGIDQLKMFKPTANLERYFCKVCGSHVLTTDVRSPGTYWFPAGIFEGQSIEEPVENYFVEHKAAWF